MNLNIFSDKGFITSILPEEAKFFPLDLRAGSLSRDLKFDNSQDTDIRRKLSKLLPLGGRLGYIATDWMANISSKALYSEFQKRMDGKSHNFEWVRACAEEDFENLVRVLNGQDALKTKFNLPLNTTLPLRRNKFANPVLSKITTEALPENIKHIITPGLGAIYNALMAKATRGIDWTLCDLSLSQGREDMLHPEDIKNLPNEKNSIVAFDGYIATGITLDVAKSCLDQIGIQCMTGGSVVDYSAYNGEHQKIDFLPPLSIPGMSATDVKWSLENGKRRTQRSDFEPHTIEYRNKIEKAIQGDL